MKMTRETRDDVLVLRLSGQLMGGPDADAVREAIQEALRQGGRKILFDLGELTWVNSTGLGILISAHINASNLGGKVGLARVSRRIESILAVTRLDTVFQAFADEETALRALAS
jgi:anti-sigma B factor antagonist